ncbi:MAG: hypothetical protein K2N70_03425, partial [Helicobacter sp.]|nr:hypothetical protein [Helicobacter sp.]
PLARFFNVRCTCICRAPQRMRQRYAFRLEHCRCALWLGRLHNEQWQIQCATKVAPPIFLVSLRASNASAAINRQGILTMWGNQTRLIATRLNPLAMTDRCSIASHKLAMANGQILRIAI